MKLAMSNIAWRPEEDAAVATLLTRDGFQAVEIAPTRVWKDPLQAPPAEIRAHRTFWADQGLPIVALQSLLFGHPELTLFDSTEARQAMRDYLAGMIHLGAALGASVLVFGSPKNRQRQGLSVEAAQAIAIDFFRDLGNVALSAGVRFCIEPNPSFYDCDFVTTSAEGQQLVQAVNSPGFCLHLDAAGMTLAGEAPQALRAAQDAIAHFHVSEKNLAPIGTGSVDHERFAEELRQAHYAHWVSVEMRPGEGSNLERIEAVLKKVQLTYGH